MGPGESTLRWEHASVDGRPALYLVGGAGRPMVFLHGWALANRTYEHSLSRVAGDGARVYAPALPGFGGTPELPWDDPTLGDYAAWVAEFVGAVGITEPVLLIGHSFGGGVAIQTAHDFPDIIGQLVIVNSIGGSAWKEGEVLRSMSERPLWDWGIHLQADVMPLRQLTRVFPVIARDLVSNITHNPRALWHVGRLARTSNLIAELEELKRRELPITIVWGDRDRVIPEAAVRSMHEALGDAPFVTVPGNHNWLLADPDAFGEVITNIVGLPELLAPDDPDGPPEPEAEAS